MLQKIIFLPLITLLSSVVITCVLTSQFAGAADARNFNPGRIIDDGIFTNKDSMSVQDIQNFFNSKVTCDTWGVKTSELGEGTRRQWMANRGIYPPFRCVTDYYENPSTKENNYGKNDRPTGSISAAEIVYTYSRQFNINPQVIIATLQKENGMITDEWPTPKQFTEAMGFACPDNVAPGAPACDPAYKSFASQVYEAARHFRGYINNTAGWYVPYTTGSNSILWNPNQACGRSTVNIENRATVALYSYTPYRPNQAALNAQYGTGDGCSAYGNRNFYLYFNDWFGSTLTPSYRWQPDSQTAHTDASKANNADLNNLVATSPQRTYHTVRILNTGTATWNKWSVNLGTSQPQDRSSAIYDSTWLSPSRPATLNETSVAPGQYGTFSFWTATPTKPGVYKEYFNVVSEGITWMNDMGLHYTLNVQPAKYTWTSESQQVFTDSSKQTPVDTANMVTGDRVFMSVRAKNTGNIAWNKHQVNFATSGPHNRTSSIKTNEWLSGNRAATLTEDSVLPGEIGTFEFWVTIPNAGNYKEYFNLVRENVAWMTDIGFYQPFTAATAKYIWQPVSQTSYTDATKSTAANTNQLSPGQRVFLEIKAKNVGNTIWRQGNLNLATNSPRNRSSAYYDSTWMSANRPTTLQEASISPGQIGTFTFWVKAPSTPGTTKEYFNFVSEYNSWLNDLGLYYSFTVQ